MTSRRHKSRRAPSTNQSSGRRTETSASGRAHWLSAVLLVVLVVVAYLPVWHAGFIWDDDQHLTKNPCIIGPLGFGDIWTSAQAYYYPLVLTTFWIINKFAGLNPQPYHVLNVLMHAGSAVLLWRVLLKLNVRAAWLGAALWALHPVMVQSVAWITELKNTQSCFFYLLSILFFLNAERTQRQRHFVLSLLFFSMAITSKTSTVMLPVVLGLCLWWRDGSFRSRQLVRLAPFFLISAAASAWTIWEQRFHSGALGVQWSQTWAERFAIAGYDLWFYLFKLAWPGALSFFYPQWNIDTSKLSTFIPVAAALFGFAFLFWKRNGPLRPLFVTAFYFGVSLFPVLGFFNIFFFRYSFVSDHFQYLAAMGPLALAASGIAVCARGFGRIKILEPALTAVLLLSLGILTWRQTAHYASAENVYRMAIDRNPDCWPAYTNLGAQYLQERRFDDAIGYCEKALAIKPNVAETQYNLGNCYLAKGDFASAIEPYRAALRLQPHNPRTHSNLAACLASTGNINDALDQWQEAIRVDPDYAEAHFNLGYVLAQLGRREEAISHLNEALRLKPDYAAAREQLRALGAPQF